jgi:SAM-dependent methyltransferase
VEDNITETYFREGSFDWVFSWLTFEHVMDPGRVISNIARLLRPGGIFYSMYNPFFCLNGGHSLCILDFSWGQVLQNPEDFERYLDEFRPREKEQAREFFTQNLNRMTLNEVQEYLIAAGLDILLFLPIPNPEHLSVLPAGTYRRAKQIYPRITINDLISPDVFIIAKKPVR